MSKPKVTVLWNRLSGYFNTCLQELAPEVADLIVVRRKIDPLQAPFDRKEFAWISQQFDVEKELKSAEVAIASQQPDILLVGGWLNPNYNRLSKKYKSQGSLVIAACDNPWSNTIKQKIASAIAKYWINQYFDSLWVPGSKSVSLAKKLGFKNEQILLGLYTCNIADFAPIYQFKTQNLELPTVFLYVGRYVEIKGIRNLLNAYQIYRKNSIGEPWQLWFAGSGPLESEIEKFPGVKNFGFTQPHQLPSLMSQAGTLILPSDREHWGVVVHEATSAGLPVICTQTCGSTPELVQDRVNGYVVDPKDPIALSAAMSKISQSSDRELWQLSKQSYQLSLAYSPQKWVQTFLSAYQNHISHQA